VIQDYTTVVGVDAKHLRQLARSWPTWKEHKPSLLAHPMLVFHDREQVNALDVREVVDHPNLWTYCWPPVGVNYGDGLDTAGMSERERYAAMWTSSQRHKMLAGYVHAPALWVETPYWLKLDTCVFATGQDDWIDPAWFDDGSAIISHRWGYTKPPNQMMELDRWAKEQRDHSFLLAGTNSLNLVPKPGAKHLSHRRIISWCAFFNTLFTRECARVATMSCGLCQLPVPSQDGYLWYLAKRSGRGIMRTNMKKLGWDHRPVRDFSMDVLKEK